MELTKNIFFNTDKLITNTVVKISYTGRLFQDGAKEVYIHYGFGENWDNVNDLKMEKTELGFQAEIPLIEASTFNFCFKDDEDNWDNNINANYIFPIEQLQQNALTVTEQSEFGLAPHRLRRTYIWSKKIKLAVYKILRYVPKLISGNYKRKISNQENQ